MSASLKRLIRKKRRVYNKARLSYHEADWSQYKAMKREVKYMLKSQHKNYLISGHDFLPQHPLWHYIKAQRQEHTGISTLKDSTSGHIITDPAEKANALNEHFKSVFTVEDNETIPNKGISLYQEFIIYIYIYIYIYISRRAVVSREAKKKQHAYAPSGQCDHYSELFTRMDGLNF